MGTIEEVMEIAQEKHLMVHGFWTLSRDAQWVLTKKKNLTNY